MMLYTFIISIVQFAHLVFGGAAAPVIDDYQFTASQTAEITEQDDQILASYDIRSVKVRGIDYLVMQENKSDGGLQTLRLLVEDNNFNRDYIRRILQQEQYEYSLCFNGTDSYFGNSSGGGDVSLTLWSDDDKILLNIDEWPEELTEIANGCVLVLAVSDRGNLLIQKTQADGYVSRTKFYTFNPESLELSLIDSNQGATLDF